MADNVTPITTEYITQSIEEVLNLFPEVTWDRYTEFKGVLTIYGWIDRENDSYKDFVQMEFFYNEARTISTSSAKYSQEFSDRLGWPSHQDCKRAEDRFTKANCTHI